MEYEKPKLRLIEGGLCDKTQAEKRFVSAFVTDTRLMGQIAMGIHWKILDHPEAEDLYQYFSFDAEECGLDNYKSVWDGNVDAMDHIRQTMIGPLGGQDVIISEKEARALFTEFYLKNKENGPTFRAGLHEYKFLIDEPVFLNEEEDHSLLVKMCKPIETDEELVNYYIMRMCAKDFKAAALLTDGEGLFDLFEEYPLVTLLKNSIQESEEGYLCHSLLDKDGYYDIVVTTVTVENLKVTSASRGSKMGISYQEAALMLSQPEFLTVYRIIVGPEEFEDRPLEFNYNVMVTEYANGRMYMAFNKDNSHVNNRVFKLSGDVFGLYFITYNGEFIVASQSKESIIKMERDLLHQDIGSFLLPTGKFEFQEPVLLQFANSDIDFFEEFLELIIGDE